MLVHLETDDNECVASVVVIDIVTLVARTKRTSGHFVSNGDVAVSSLSRLINCSLVKTLLRP